MRQVKEPALTSPTETDWQYELANRTHGRMNYISIDIDLTNRALKAGSQAVVGGALYEEPVDEGWAGTIINLTDNYLIFKPDGNGDGWLSVMTDAVTWDAARGGYYSQTARVLAKIRNFNGSLSFVTLARKEDLYVDYPTPSLLNTASGGTLVHTGTVNTEKIDSLVVGTYRVEVVGGKGGSGAKANNAGGNGGAGANGQKITKILTLDKTYFCKSYVGGDGNDADPIGFTKGGGGGASGMDSLFVLYDTDGIKEQILALGGSAGGGGQDSDSEGGGGGGGGSRYGQAENGWNYSNTTQNNGKGGNYNQKASGGDGYNAYGGKGGEGGNSETDFAGVKGISGAAEYSAAGGAGGAATKVDVPIITAENEYGLTETVMITLISCGGGGAGGRNGHATERSGVGASGVKSTSSGYVKVYRLW